MIYDWPTVHINSLKDLARASDYFSEAGATPATKALVDKHSNILMVKGRQNHLVYQKFIHLLVKVMQVIRFHLKRKVQQLISCTMQQVGVL